MFEVENFVYNGFYVQSKPGRAKYTAEFIKWTKDPGVAICMCSDKQVRNIPSCCLIGDQDILPKQEKTGVIFGDSCNS